MRLAVFVSLIIFTGISCQPEKFTLEELFGEWMYQRSVPQLFTFLVDSDRAGLITFREDKTGEWISTSEDSLNYRLEWKLDFDEQKIKITKYLGQQTILEDSSEIYTLDRTDEDQFELSLEHRSGVHISTERIVLKRK